MLEIGKYNMLAVAREVDFGYYLATDDGREILLPRKYAPDGIAIGKAVKVFVYTDSDDRLIATTETPYATVGEFAYVQVSDVNATGAFLDWGITAKDLLVPFSQQKARMKRGGIYLVYVYLDDASKRVVASAKIEKYLDNALPEYRHGQPVEALVIEHTPIGYKVIVDNRHRGMIYDNEIYRPLELEQTVRAYVKSVRPDGKIDLSLGDSTGRRVMSLCDRIIEVLEQAGGRITVTDRSTPDDIKEAFACSKKDFKKALGHLYKEGKVLLGEDVVELAK